MKIDRLIGILSVLLQEEKVTAPMLAEKFEVTRRTINRDIEDLCKAGIPIQTIRGTGGGIRIMDGFRMDRTLLTSKDMQMILAGLKGLDSVSGSNYYTQLMEKLKAGSSEFISAGETILIDLASWYKDSVAPKIELFQKAIEEKRFTAKEIPMPDLSDGTVFPEDIQVKAIFDVSMKWHLIEEYGPGSFTEQTDGTLLFEQTYTNKDSLLSWMLTCRDKVTVLEPEDVRGELLEIVENIRKKYEEG